MISMAIDITSRGRITRLESATICQKTCHSNVFQKLELLLSRLEAFLVLPGGQSSRVKHYKYSDENVFHFGASGVSLFEIEAIILYILLLTNQLKYLSLDLKLTFEWL